MLYRVGQVAVQYSKVQEGNPLPRVLLISVGSVDRGACIAALSQAPPRRAHTK